MLSLWSSLTLPKMSMLERQTQLRGFLRTIRARLQPADVNLPTRGHRRVPGLRSTEVAELAQVSAGWYEQFESGTSRRAFSLAFVRSVGSALRLNEREQATLLRLAFPDIARAIRIFEAAAREGAEQYVLQTRELVHRLSTAGSFEDATKILVDAAQAIIGPTCVAMAAIENGSLEPTTFAAGPRAHYVGPTIGRCLLDMNHSARHSAIILCENAPHPNAVTDDATHRVRIKDVYGRETPGMHDVAANTYRLCNSDLLVRSELVAGLFEGGVFRGVLSCAWTEPRRHSAIEVAMIETLVSILSLFNASVKHSSA
jgi:hypothetical protein